MRHARPVSVIFTGILTALFYVHVQVELVKISYEINCKEKILQDMLDRKESLGYNIANLEDPSRLEGALLARNVDVIFPAKHQVFKVAYARSKSERSEYLARLSGEKKGVFFGLLEFFGMNREAQAKER